MSITSDGRCSDPTCGLCAKPRPQVGSTTDSIVTARTYRLHELGFDLDGHQFPWHVLAKGPHLERAEEFGGRMHVLWVPIIIDAILPPEKPSDPAEPVALRAETAGES